MNAIWLIFICILLVIICTYIFNDYLPNLRLGLKNEYIRNRKILNKYEVEILHGDPLVFDNYHIQRNYFNGYIDPIFNTKNHYHKFEIQNIKKNIKYIEDNFSDLPFIKAAIRDKVINGILNDIE